jgi:hypothetical protein
VWELHGVGWGLGGQVVRLSCAIERGEELRQDGIELERVTLVCK